MKVTGKETAVQDWKVLKLKKEDEQLIQQQAGGQTPMTGKRLLDRQNSLVQRTVSRSVSRLMT